jgi:hypothetical protein
VDGLLLATGAMSLLSAVVYAYVAYRLFQRPVSADARLAATLFSVWWFGLSGAAFLTAVEIALSAAGVLSLAAALTISVLALLVDCVFLWALVDFLVYVYTGRYRFGLVAGLYALFTFLALYYFFLGHPSAVVLSAGLPTLRSSPVTIRPLVDAVDVGLVFPELVGGALYLTLLRRTRDRTLRFRITVVGVGILFWFGMTFFFPAVSVGLVLLRGALLLIPPLLVLIAYLPPEWLRGRLGVLGIGTPRASSSRERTG